VRCGVEVIGHCGILLAKGAHRVPDDRQAVSPRGREHGGNGRVDDTNPLRRGDSWVRSAKINQARGRVLQSHDVVGPIRFRRAKESPNSKVLFNQVFDEV
jgi:hypothetical protein